MAIFVTSVGESSMRAISFFGTRFSEQAVTYLIVLVCDGFFFFLLHKNCVLLASA